MKMYFELQKKLRYVEQPPVYSLRMPDNCRVIHHADTIRSAFLQNCRDLAIGLRSTYVCQNIIDSHLA